MTPEVIVHVRGDGCTMDDGTPVPDSTVARLLPDSFVRLMINEAERLPINASGKHRFPTERQRRLVKARDEVCRDCGESYLPDNDHVPNFEDSRRTVIDELQLRCKPCHRRRHAAEDEAAGGKPRRRKPRP